MMSKLQVIEEVVLTLEDDTGANENPKMPSIDGKEAKLKLGKAGKLQNDSENSEKKPDKILPCPRCSSMDTKFRYYNNYNINEPRHFCKACQRYWIAWGTMRNVAVGAGRRRKNSGSQTRHLRSIERVVSFALGEKKLHSVTRDCLHDKLRDRVDDCSSGSSITISNSTDEGGTMSMTEPETRKLPCLSAAPWPYQWQFHPKPLWNVPLLSPKSSPVQTSPKSDPSPAQLGKHSREDNEEQLDNEKLREQVSNGCVLVPKTLRIGDPDEPAKISSIWAALGIKNEYSLAFGGIPKSKSIEMNCASEKNLIMQANPAAFSRSQSFQESS